MTIAAPSAAGTPAWTARRAATIGPGLVFALEVVGPRDLVANAIAGSVSGYGLLWLVALAGVMRFVVLEATARYVLATGHSLLAGLGNWNRAVVWLWFIVAMLRRHVSTLVYFVLLGTSAHFVVPLPTRHSALIWSFVSWIAGFAIVYWGRYGLVDRFGKPLAAVLGLSLVAAALLSRPNVSELISGAFSPVLPSTGLYPPVVILMAVLSGGVGSTSNLTYAAYVHEKGWREPSYLRKQRLDLFTGIAAMAVMLALVQIAAAGALRPRGIEVREIEDLLPIFASVLGDGGRIVLGATLWSVVFGNYVNSSAAYGLMIADVYHRFVRPSTAIAAQDRGAGASYLPAYRWLLWYVFLSPLYVFLTNWTPVGLVLFQGVASVATLPIVVLVVMRMTSDRKMMGTLANGVVTNLVLAATAAGSAYLAFEATAGLWRQLASSTLGVG